jgi:hypothetical protein
MSRTTLTAQRFVFLFLLGVFLFFSPFVLLFERPLAAFGIPLLYLYLLGAWIVLIAISIWILRSDAG